MVRVSKYLPKYLPRYLVIFFSLVMLTACQLLQIPPDTGATDPDRFVVETAPLWNRKAVVLRSPGSACDWRAKKYYQCCGWVNFCA